MYSIPQIQWRILRGRVVKNTLGVFIFCHLESMDNLSRMCRCTTQIIEPVILNIPEPCEYWDHRLAYFEHPNVHAYARSIDGRKPDPRCNSRATTPERSGSLTVH